MLTPNWRILVLLSCCLLAACPRSLGTAIERYAEARSCCKEIREFTFTKLTQSDSRTFDIDDKSQAFTFDTGKSYFAAFELPAFSSRYHIIIRSYLGGPEFGRYIFYPYVFLLDHGYRVTRTMGAESFQWRKAGLVEVMRMNASVGRKLEGRIDFGDGDAREKFLIILTTTALRMAATATRRLWAAPVSTPGLGMVPMPSGKQEVYIAHGPTGHLNVTLESGEP